jgi:hypothetical protein
MDVSGVRHLVERAHRESGTLQYLRELVMNSLEAGASHIEIGPEWAAVKREKAYRLMIADNGKGMNPDELLKFLNTFGGGGKPIGDVHENFGVGAKTSLLPWNHYGIAVVSWTKDNPDGAMVWLMRDPKSGEYGAKKFLLDDHTYEDVIIPPQEYTDARPPWIGDHGTIVVCTGNTGCEDTFLGKAGDIDIKGVSAYLNKRFWKFDVELYVQELRSDKRDDWPRTLEEAAGTKTKPDRRWNRRRIHGAARFIEIETDKGKLAHRGTVELRDGTEIDWYLWDGERPAVHSYAHKNGYIAALYKDELYDTEPHIGRYRSFGITQGAVRANLTIIARPPHSNSGSYGVYPDTTRNTLKIQGTKRAGQSLPWFEWAQEFADNLPTPIQEALAKAAPPSSGTIKDESWKARLNDRFGNRWLSLRYIPDKKDTKRIDPNENSSSTGGGRGGNGYRNKPSGPFNIAAKTDADKPVSARPVKSKGGLPKWEWTVMSNLDPDTAYAAAWCPPNKSEPGGIIQLARDFPAIVEIKNYWRSQFASHHGDQIDQTIEDVYGETMVARIAHSESLASHPSWGRSKLERELRSPTSLTMSILGLLSEDYLISARLRSKFGPLKTNKPRAA